MLKPFFTIILMLICAVTAMAEGASTVYSWESPEGVVMEYGGKLEQHNFRYVDYVNYKSSDYYTVGLVGNKDNIDDTDNSFESIYFMLTLANGTTFREGDELRITAMRNNDKGGNANIHFVYSKGAIVEDNSVWNNLGQLSELSFSGGSEGSEPKKIYSAASVTENSGFSTVPNEVVFIIPREADGSTWLKLTRNEDECILYITKIELVHKDVTGVSAVMDGVQLNRLSQAYDLSGRHVYSDNRSIKILNGKKIFCK